MYFFTAIQILFDLLVLTVTIAALAFWIHWWTLAVIGGVIYLFVKLITHVARA